MSGIYQVMARLVRSALMAGVAGLGVSLSATGASAQACGNTGAGFDAWLAGYKSRAAAQGVSASAMASGLAGMSYDQSVINLDRGQRSFKLSFEQFYARRVSGSLISRGQSLMASNRALLDRIEKTYGVPGAVLISIWGLETNYARSSGGSKSIFRSLATLAYDCRRAKFFENELTNALKIIQRGDKSVGQMRGGWAGEIGPMQFLPSSYMKYAVDFDGDGRRDLFNSVPDMLASTANYLKGHGWKAGQPWGPGTANYGAIREWNKAEVYQRTIAVMSEKLAGR
jgi:lytic murein transglycosylase